MEIYGNASTFNLENVLRQNITACEYYRRDCTALADWQAVIDEIYNAVEDVEPWIGGNARGPSSAFCLLHRLFTLRMSIEEVSATLNHADSPFIRAIGFLYLRYVCDPRNLWNWFEGYVEDKEEFKPSRWAPAVTIGDFVRDLLLDQYYFETIFPRIPKKVQDDINAALQARGLPTTAKGNAGTGGADRRGGDDGGNRRPASVKASLSVAMGQKAPNRAGTKDYGVREAIWEEKMSSRPASGGGGGGGGGRGREEREEPRDREERVKGRDERDKERDYGRERYSSREREREPDRSRGEYGREQYSSREREREPDRSRGEYGRGDKDRDRDYDRRGAGYSGRERPASPYERPPRSPYSRRASSRSPRRDYDRGGERERERRSPARRYSRSRSRSPRRGGGAGGGGGSGRDARDVFKDSAADLAAAGDVRSRYGDASGSRLFEERGSGGSRGRTSEEVYRLGSRKGGGYR